MVANALPPELLCCCCCCSWSGVPAAPFEEAVAAAAATAAAPIALSNAVGELPTKLAAVINRSIMFLLDVAAATSAADVERSIEPTAASPAPLPPPLSIVAGEVLLTDLSLASQSAPCAAALCFDDITYPPPAELRASFRRIGVMSGFSTGAACAATVR